VCRKSYINPIVFAAWRCGSLSIECTRTASGRPRRLEEWTLAFLRREKRRVMRRIKA